MEPHADYMDDPSDSWVSDLFPPAIDPATQGVTQTQEDQRRTKNRLAQRKRREQLRQSQRVQTQQRCGSTATGHTRTPSNFDSPQNSPQNSQKGMPFNLQTFNFNPAETSPTDLVLHKPLDLISPVVQDYDPSHTHDAFQPLFSTSASYPDPVIVSGALPQPGHVSYDRPIFDFSLNDMNMSQTASFSPKSTSIVPTVPTAPDASTYRRHSTPISRFQPSSAEQMLAVNISNLNCETHVTKEAEFQNAESLITACAARKDQQATRPTGLEESPAHTLLHLLSQLHRHSSVSSSTSFSSSNSYKAQRSPDDGLKRITQHGIGIGQHDQKKREFVAKTIDQLLQDDTTDALWRRDMISMDRQMPGIWPEVLEMAKQANVEADRMARALCVCLWMLELPS
ncbi:hypothetical protein PG989_013984 [Apiospora arundinis]